MIRTFSSKQLTIAEFDWSFEMALSKNNRWVKLSDCIPCDELAESYYQGLVTDRGRSLKEARLVISVVIIKHKLRLSNIETVQQIQENRYMQYFVGLPGYQPIAPFAPTLLVEIRNRMGETVFEGFHRAIIKAHESKRPIKPSTPPLAETTTPAEIAAPVETESQAAAKNRSLDSTDVTEALTAPESESSETTPQGQLILDATGLEQANRFPTDLSLLDEAREFSERIIDQLCNHLKEAQNPSAYRRKARSAYLAIAKLRRLGRKTCDHRIVSICPTRA